MRPFVVFINRILTLGGCAQKENECDEWCQHSVDVVAEYSCYGLMRCCSEKTVSERLALYKDAGSREIR
jgi:hypothetical protein